MKLYKEHFDSINSLLKTLDSRSNNEGMKNENSSNCDDFKFTKTKSYKEAEELIRSGYKDILDKIRCGVKKKEKKFKSENKQILDKTRPRNHIVGFIPNVPNALQNLPDSMITIDKTIQKKKTLNINYIMCGHCGEDAQLWIDAGITLLTAIKLIELSGVTVKLNVCFFGGYTHDSNTFATLCVKEYKDKLDIQKLCFPLAHPSMFRRLGFKWIETFPGMTDTGFQGGYGYPPKDIVTWFQNKVGKLPDHTFILSAQQIRDYNYDLDKLINYLK